jgi:hypothetical protein
MSRTADDLTASLVPARTTLILGAGASLPSGAPSASQLAVKIAEAARIDHSDLSLAEVASIAENTIGRPDLIKLVRKVFERVEPKGSILNVPLWDWRSIYSTNYDHLVEIAYQRVNKPLRTYSSNFDFTGEESIADARLFKFHGTLDKDISNGHHSRIVITQQDFDLTRDYRELIYTRMELDVLESHRTIIIGNSLTDPDLKEVIDRCIKIHHKSQGSNQVYMLMYTRDERRASLMEDRGIRVAFGGIDDFFLSLPTHHKPRPTEGSTDDALSLVPTLRPTTLCVADELSNRSESASQMFNGWPATYSDISSGYTFPRDVTDAMFQRVVEQSSPCTVLLGASGVGKTTAVRQLISRIVKEVGWEAWEHKTDHGVHADDWIELDTQLRRRSRVGVLFIDDSHRHLPAINRLLDSINASPTPGLRLILTSSRNKWSPRVKSPHVFSSGREFAVSRLTGREIDKLLRLVSQVPELRSLVEKGFGGFSDAEKRRRLVERCHSDMFVCLRNIFASSRLDDIILREYADLEHEPREVYKHVAALEHAGVNVHRQLVVRILGVSSTAISGVLAGLQDIVTEYIVDDRQGIFGWRVRHPVIAEIVSTYKFDDVDERVALYERVISSISPTYAIEVRTLRDLCDLEGGVMSIPDRDIQNRLLRQMMSIAPGERVPRYRLVRNLIDSEDFEQAETEIRLFEKDFGYDATITRYRVLLILSRSRASGLLDEDRVVIIRRAIAQAMAAIDRHSLNWRMLDVYAEASLELFVRTGETESFKDAMARLKRAEQRIGDSEISRAVRRWEKRIGMRRRDALATRDRGRG